MPTRTVFDLDPSSEAGAGRPVEVHVTCIVCAQQVPISEAVVPEARDYVVYLCGLDCYARWISGGTPPVSG